MAWLRRLVHRLFHWHRFEPFVLVDIDRNHFSRGVRCVICGVIDDGPA
jgi:hypothetical protein